MSKEHADEKGENRDWEKLSNIRFLARGDQNDLVPNAYPPPPPIKTNKEGPKIKKNFRVGDDFWIRGDGPDMVFVNPFTVVDAITVLIQCYS